MNFLQKLKRFSFISQYKIKFFNDKLNEKFNYYTGITWIRNKPKKQRELIVKIGNIFLIALFVFVLLYLFIDFASRLYGIGIIKTQSIDKNIFVYEKNIKTELKNKLIYFSLPIQTKYFDKGSNFGKYVRCIGGEVLITKDLNYYCGDEYLGVAKTTDKNGNSVEPFVFNGIIPKNKFFVMGTHERSFDSRYWGFVGKEDIKGVATWAI